MSDRLKELSSQLEGKRTEVETILAKAEWSDEDRTKTTQLEKDMDEITALIDKHNADQKRAADLRTKLDDNKKSMKEINRKLPFPTKEDKGVEFDSLEGGDSEFDKKWPTGGFKSAGHFVHSLYKAGPFRKGDETSVKNLQDWEDLQRKAPSGMFEDSDPDGGLLVPVTFSMEIYRRMVTMNSIMQYLNPITVTGKTMKLLALAENSRVNGSRWGGVQGYWRKEGFQYTTSKPQFRDVGLELKKLTVEVIATEELLEDSAVALETWLNTVVPEEFNFQLNDAVINGTGAGVPRGIMQSGSKVIVPAVTGGTNTGTIIYQNIVDMYSRVTASQRDSLIWLYNQDAESALSRMFAPTGTAAGVLIFTPNEGGGFRLNGRPALVMEQASSIGTEGDLIAFATRGYACIKKGVTQNDVSMHLRFEFDERVFKWRFRFDGEPYDNTPLTPYKGTNTTSSVVTLSSTRT